MAFRRFCFTLPDVELGSIIEYRYATRYSDRYYQPPDWYIQGGLFVKSAYYAWYPTIRFLYSEKGAINTITWFPILPVGARIERKELPAQPGQDSGQQIYSLDIRDVSPVTRKEYMPPIANYSYRVLFNFSPYRCPEEFWKAEGKDWSRQANSFANPNSELVKATQAITAGASSDDQKLQKIYAAVMTIENTDFTREHERREDKATVSASSPMPPRSWITSAATQRRSLSSSWEWRGPPGSRPISCWSRTVPSRSLFQAG